VGLLVSDTSTGCLQLRKPQRQWRPRHQTHLNRFIPNL